MKEYTFQKSQELFRQAASLIPNGIYGHQSPALTVPGSFPYYAVKASGAHYWDVDGNRFIDYMCGYGPIVLGHNHPVVEKAAKAQAAQAQCLNHPAPVAVELARRLTGLIDNADWAVFAKNGSDLTTWAIQVAREYTGRSKIAKARGAYHGAHAWCTPGHGGIIDEDIDPIVLFAWNDLDGIRKLFAADPDGIAAVIVTPYHHPAPGDQIMPAPGFYTGLRELCDRNGALLIMDDVRAGFRLSLAGSASHFGVAADIQVFCKAIGNGHPLSAAVGRQAFKPAAANVFLTGSYWNGPVPMAAAIACIDELERAGAVEHMRLMGERLMGGLEELGKRHGTPVVCSGPPAIPYMRFANETNYLRSQLFSAEVSKRGAFLHPHHNWFVCAAHTTTDIDDTLAMADEAFAIVKREFGN